jgi:hypothetical protein
MKPVSGKRFFIALGRSEESRGVPYLTNRQLRQAWPEWAVRAYCLGRLHQVPDLATRTDDIAPLLRALIPAMARRQPSST